MITRHSIDLREVSDPCFATFREGGCRVLIRVEEGCGTIGCPFYKPRGCREWIRTDDGNLIPPEEYYRREK